MKETYISSDKEIIGSIFSSNNSYRVPLYQRSFSWDGDEIEQLWLDISETINLGRKEYFLGSLVVVKRDDNLKEIIDGQQRLATLSIILCILRDLLNSLGDESRSAQIDSYLGKRDFRTQEISPRLILNETDDPFYRNNILKNKGIKEIEKLVPNKNIPRSNQLIAKAYIEFSRFIQEQLKKDHEKKDFLYDLYYCIIDKLCVIEISVTDEADAYALFETLNDRGLDLSISDLLKNFIFSKAGESLSEVKKRWDEISLVLFNKGLPQFLRHYWISKNGLVREKELYRKVRDTHRNAREILPFVNELREGANIYAAFRQPDNEIWDSFGTQVKEDLATLRLFKVVQCLPLLFASYQVLNNKLFASILKMAVVISFRYNIICGKRTGLLERVYGDVSVRIRKKELTKPAKIFKALSSIYPENEEFAVSFSERSIKNARLARYILLKIESFKNTSLEYEPCGDERKVNLEHIFPTNTNREWIKQSNREDLEDFVNLIGNLTLLPSSINRSIGTESFSSKCKRAYANSDFEITKQLCEYSKWRPEDIRKRQREFAKIATKIWSLRQ